MLFSTDLASLLVDQIRNLLISIYNDNNTTLLKQMMKYSTKRYKSQQIWQQFSLCVDLNIPFLLYRE